MEGVHLFGPSLNKVVHLSSQVQAIHSTAVAARPKSTAYNKQTKAELDQSVEPLQGSDADESSALTRAVHDELQAARDESSRVG